MPEGDEDLDVSVTLLEQDGTVSDETLPVNPLEEDTTILDRTSPAPQIDLDNSDSDSDLSDDDDPISRRWWDEVSDDDVDVISQVENVDNGPNEADDGIEELASAVNTATPLSNPEDNEFLRVPTALENLRAELLGDYQCPESPPDKPPQIRALSQTEIYSLKHYAVWVKTNGTVEAYTMHSEVLACVSNTDILSLRDVKKLAGNLVDFKPRMVDICVNSCIAYTGKYKGLMNCPYRNGKPGSPPCNEPRYRQSTRSTRVLKPRAQIPILPFMPRVRGLYFNKTTSSMMRSLHSFLQHALELVAAAMNKSKVPRYSDFGNGQVHEILRGKLGVLKDPRDVALALSTDGAQLTLKKQSNTWFVLFLFLNLPAEIRYKVSSTFIHFATPGPNPPGDMESFLWPVFEEMMQASEGIWTWDAVDSSYFCL
ncbi:hypothetical protein CVT26_001344 [Gymnopilus dilepis]|uniref:Uncharacterized protein n=1 Tax=Gymnopilus dilepis TaxID=231916 RepID=A0A409X3H8_9AGAR|nr:hypothetical protein CVT26_001344 [Gymnopilus dilepis]